MMKVTVFIPNSTRLGSIGFKSVMHTPVLFDSKNRYIREVNRYLRERSQGSEENDFIKRSGKSAKGASPIYVKNIAYILSNFIEWCEYKKKHWNSVTYDDVIEYQNSQLSALRPNGKRSLSAATANQRADEATHFLQWASLRELRPAFTYAKVQINRRFSSSSGRGTAITWVRAKRAKEDQNKEIHILDGLPNAADLKHWLQKVRSELGQSLYLACRVILEAGLRKMEVCSLLTTQFPPKPDIVSAMESGRSFVPVHLTVTKGSKPRTVEIPCLLALEISEYVNGRRLVLAFRHKKRMEREPRPHDIRTPPRNYLFLQEARNYEGLPISAHVLYRCFTRRSKLTRRWSPHMGRHTFACFFVLYALENESRSAGHSVSEMGAGWIEARGQFWMTILRKQLGHAHQDTTDIYLRWIMSTTLVSDLASGWHSYLNSPDAPE